MLRAPAHLPQKLGPADHLVKAAHAQPRQNLARFLGDEGHQVDDLFRRADELLPELFILRADTHRAGVGMALAHHDARSEEHTSELQSLMRISYAVFWLKKKKQQHTSNNKHNHTNQ